MILTVTLNAALDVTYRLPTVAWNGTNRVDEIACRAGGKGINVTRYLQALGHESVLTGMVGGSTGHAIRAELAASGRADSLAWINNESRRTLAIVCPAETTLFNEAGPIVTGVEWARFLDTFRGLVERASAVVLAGSLPPGLPINAYAQLCEVAAEAGKSAVLDTDGGALTAGIAGRPAVVKSNAEELARAAEGCDPAGAMESLRESGAGAVVASLGPDGLLALTPDERWSAKPPRRLKGNSAGAGDAVVAALTIGLVTGQPWPERLRHAVALSAAAVLSPLAGDFDRLAYGRLLSAVRVEAI